MCLENMFLFSWDGRIETFYVHLLFCRASKLRVVKLVIYSELLLLCTCIELKSGHQNMRQIAFNCQ